MDTNLTTLKARRSLFASVVVPMIVALALASCGQPDNATLKPSSPTTIAPSATPAAQPSATATLTGPELDAAKPQDEEQRQRDLATVEAGGELPTPVETPNAWQA